MTHPDQPRAVVPGVDQGANLTEQALTDADRAALYPTAPYEVGDAAPDGQATVDDFNGTHGSCVWVRYWTGTRDDTPKCGLTDGKAWLLGGHTPVVRVRGTAGCIALTHVDPIPGQPDNIEDDTRGLPEPAGAAERVGEYIAATGDGIYDVQDGHPLYARDLEALRRAVADAHARTATASEETTDAPDCAFCAAPTTKRLIGGAAADCPLHGQPPAADQPALDLEAIRARLVNQWTWQHNQFVAERDATTDRAAAEHLAEQCRSANPGHDVGLVGRTVTPWTAVLDDAAHARQDIPALLDAIAARDSQIASLHRETDRQRIYIRELEQQCNEQLQELKHVGRVLADWRRNSVDEDAQEADRVLTDLIDARMVPDANGQVAPVEQASPITADGTR
ncbi:MAG TPA: hypothetical protein VFR67_06085 [Pilimelia sp.]|nr:hypothetical protein [Pilimelia sp.]